MYLFDYLMFLLNFTFIIIMVMLSVAFLTLMERKVLGYVQFRSGPNSVGYTGIIQPFADAIKLFSSEQVFPYMSNYFMYYFSPMYSLFLSLFIWLLFPYFTIFCSLPLGFIFLLCIMGLSIYGLMLAGWASNSNYSLRRALRAVTQTISYEVSFFFFFFEFYVASTVSLLATTTSWITLNSFSSCSFAFQTISLIDICDPNPAFEIACLFLGFFLV